jgi:hypothetical protein
MIQSQVIPDLFPRNRIQTLCAKDLVAKIGIRSVIRQEMTI